MKISDPGKNRIWLVGTAAIILLLILGFGSKLARSDLITREHVVQALEKRFDAQVEIKSLKISVFPRPAATGEELVLRRRGETGPPLITIRKFTARTGFLNLLWFPPHVRQVQLEGLEIHTPARRDGAKATEQKRGGRTLRFIIDEIVADGTVLQTVPKTAGKEPLTFDIRRLTLHSAGVDQAMRFRATLQNPKPPGDIQSAGEFGPWNRDEPSNTPVSGDYTFQNADLSVFRGIVGILSSKGKYRGELDRIETDGNTDVPDFALKTIGHPVRLTTQFHSIVDGTTGNTTLDPVDAQIERTRILTRGAVTGSTGVKGKDIALEATVIGGRIEDLLRLAVKSEKPPLLGRVDLKTLLEVPPGEIDVAEKLKLDGHFSVTGARFTSLNLEQELTSLSRRAKGQPEANGTGSVLSDLHGTFKLDSGRVYFSNLSFGIPGALLELSGTYRLRSEELDFRGTIRLEAKLSETVTGIKSILLKALDPFFKKKGAGAVIPIKITGTRRVPVFGLALGGNKQAER